MRRPRPLTLALLLSLVLHLGSVVSLRGCQVYEEEPEGEALRLEAKLSAPPAPMPPAPTPRRPKRVPPPLAPDQPSAQLPPEVAASEAPAPEQSTPELPLAAASASQSAPLAAASVAAAEASAQVPIAQRLPRQGRVLYAGSVGSLLSLRASGQATWTHDGERLQSRLSAGLLGPESSLDFSSTSRLLGNQIISESTDDRRMSKHSTSRIDQATGTVYLQRGSDARERQIKGLAVAISALPQMLLTLDESVEKAALFVVGDFWVADSVLLARGKAVLRFEGEPLETRRFVTRANNGALIEVWLAPVWQMAPARIRIELDGWVIDLEAVEVEIEGKQLFRASLPPSTD